MVVAPSRCASAIRNSSFRALLPPSARPVRSSRLSRMRGHREAPPRARRSPTASVTGVGNVASETRASDSIIARALPMMFRPILPATVLLSALVSVTVPIAGQSRAAPYRTLNDRLKPREYATLDEWQRRASYLRDHVLASAGLLPLPEKTPLRPQVFDERRRSDYSVSKVYFESLPGFYVTGNLYRPAGDNVAGPFPAILSPHGHWTYGRLENTDVMSGPGRAINLARQ